MLQPWPLSTIPSIFTKAPPSNTALPLSFAQFERQMIKERTKLGIARARAEGRWGNAKFALTPIQQKEALRMIAESRSQAEVAKVFRVHRSTLWRLLSERRVLERAA
jgi:DNA invertase Pin-like site-specific DNA recombinase